jgi:hypothetical protein
MAFHKLTKVTILFVPNSKIYLKIIKATTKLGNNTDYVLADKDNRK